MKTKEIRSLDSIQTQLKKLHYRIHVTSTDLPMATRHKVTDAANDIRRAITDIETAIAELEANP